MQPDLAFRHQESCDKVDQLTDILYELAGDQDVRVIEALAAVFAKCAVQEPEYGLSEAAVPSGFDRAGAAPDVCERRAICRRVARRASRGSLVDPTRGANAVHRIEESPVWSRDLLPIGAFGPFLFYRLTQAQQRARDWPLFERQGMPGPLES